MRWNPSKVSLRDFLHGKVSLTTYAEHLLLLWRSFLKSEKKITLMMSSEPGGEWVSLRSIVTSHTTIYGSAIHTHWRAAITVKENEKNIILGCKNDNCMNTDAERHLVGQVHHAQVRLYFEAEGWEAGHAVLWPGELMEDDGVFRVQLLLLPAQMETTASSVTKQWSLGPVSSSLCVSIVCISYCMRKTDKPNFICHFR